MTAGSGVRHSEMNESEDQPVHFLQIWMVPEERGLEPSFAERSFPAEERTNTLRPIASRSGREGSLALRQDVDVFATLLEPDCRLDHALAPGRHAWVQVARGELTVNGETLGQGDGAALSQEAAVVLEGRLNGGGPAEVLLFDLP